MESATTLSFLDIVLQATRSQLHQIRDLNQASEEAHGHTLRPSFYCKLFGIEMTDALETLALSRNDERDEKLQDFLINITPYRLDWIEDVKATEWASSSWSSDVSQLFMQSESGGTSGTVAFAVVAAAMTAQGFAVPKDLNTRLFGAKKNVAVQNAVLNAAERRRTEELKRHAQP